MDPRPALERLRVIERSSRYCINLSDRVVQCNDIVLTGGYGNVRKGILNPPGVDVAIKSPRAGPPGDDANIKHFLREVHLWSKLSHQNIVPLYGITTVFDQTVSIVSEWMGNGNARNYVGNTAIDPRPLIAGIARGLHYLHTRKPTAVFHGDLKGINVVISDRGQALLTDFGLSFLVNSSFSIPIGAGSTACTLNWAAPEVLEGGGASAAADVWSFGMTALELFTRQDPYHNIRSIKGILCSILQGPPARPDVAETCNRMTEPWWAMLDSCWNQVPDDRPAISFILKKIEKIMNSP